MTASKTKADNDLMITEVEKHLQKWMKCRIIFLFKKKSGRVCYWAAQVEDECVVGWLPRWPPRSPTSWYSQPMSSSPPPIFYQHGSVQPRVEGMVCHFQDQVVEDKTCFLLIHPLAHSVSLSSLSLWGRHLSSHSSSLGNPGGKGLSEAFFQKPEKNQGLLLTAMQAWNRTLQA